MAENWWNYEERKESGNSGWWSPSSAVDTVAKKVTDRVNTWLKNQNTYLSDYQSRNAGRKYNYQDTYVSDSSSWLEKVQKQRAESDTEADSIMAYMDQYKGYLDEDWVKSVRKTLATGKWQNDKIVESATKDNQWWSNWATEDEYKTSQRYDGYNQKYKGLKYDDIQKALSTLEDGEEKDWLSYYQDDLYKNDRTYMSNAASGWKSYEAQKVAEAEAEKNKPWYEQIIEANPFGADTSLPSAMISQQVTNYRNDTSYREPNDDWSTAQKNRFGYLWGESHEKAYEYAEKVNNQINAEKYYAQQLAAGEGATQNGWSIAGTTLGAVSTVPMGMGVADYIDNLAEYMGRGTITQKGYLSPNEYFTAGQSAIADKFNGVDENGVAQNVLKGDAWGFLEGKGLGDLYNLGVSGAQSLAVGGIFGGLSKAAGMTEKAAKLFANAGTMTQFMGSDLRHNRRCYRGHHRKARYRWLAQARLCIYPKEGR